MIINEIATANVEPIISPTENLIDMTYNEAQDICPILNDIYQRYIKINR